MKFYYLDTKFTSGKYKGQTLEEVYEKDAEYIENSLKEDDNFLMTEEVVEELQAVNPNYSFSTEAISKRDSKEKAFDKAPDEDEDNEFEDKYDDADFDDAFDIEEIDAEDLEDLDDLYDDDDDDDDTADEYGGDYDDFADDSSWDRF